MNVRLLVDTSVMIDHLRGHSGAASLLVAAASRGEELWSVTVVRTEVRAGMRKGEERATRALLDQFRWREIDSELADLAGDFARTYLRSHPGVDTIDYLVAAATRLVDAELKTRNVKHFPMFTGLQAAY